MKVHTTLNQLKAQILADIMQERPEKNKRLAKEYDEAREGIDMLLTLRFDALGRQIEAEMDAASRRATVHLELDPCTNRLRLTPGDSIQIGGAKFVHQPENVETTVEEVEDLTAFDKVCITGLFFLFVIGFITMVGWVIDFFTSGHLIITNF